MLKGLLNRRRTQALPTSSLVVEVTEIIIPMVTYSRKKCFRAVPLKKPRRIWDSKQGFSSKIEYWGWTVGYLRFNTNLDRWEISLAMNTNLIRKDGVAVSGWNGNEEHVASLCALEDGDRLRWTRIGVGLYEDEPWHLYPDLAIKIAPIPKSSE